MGRVLILGRVCLAQGWFFLGIVCLLPSSLGATDGGVTPTGGTVAVAPEVPEVPSARVEINIPARELTLYDHNNVVDRYPIAIGQRAYKSIVMSDAIQKIEWNPWWYPPPSPWAAGEKVTPPGPHNPLGPVKLPLGRGIRIHGTNKDKSVGRAASHGCFRMHNEDAIQLGWYLQTHFSDQTDPALLNTYQKNRRRTFHVPLNQPIPVEVIYEPAVVQNDTLHLYPDVYGRVRNWFERITTVFEARGIPTLQLSQERVDALRKILKNDPLTVRVTDLLETQPPKVFSQVAPAVVSSAPVSVR